MVQLKHVISYSLSCSHLTFLLLITHHFVLSSCLLVCPSLALCLHHGATKSSDMQTRWFPHPCTSIAFQLINSPKIFAYYLVASQRSIKTGPVRPTQSDAATTIYRIRLNCQGLAQRAQPRHFSEIPWAMLLMFSPHVCAGIELGGPVTAAEAP
jgi:hypothetical protein